MESSYDWTLPPEHEQSGYMKEALTRAPGANIKHALNRVADVADNAPDTLAEVIDYLAAALYQVIETSPAPVGGYLEAIGVAKGLIEDGRDNPEYTRGVVEFIADFYGLPGVYLADRKDQVARDLGVEVS